MSDGVPKAASARQGTPVDATWVRADREPSNGHVSRDKESLSGRIDRLLARRTTGTVLLLAAAGLPLLRQQGTPSWQTVWAEDASIYTQQAVNTGAWRVILRGFNGYLQLPPRLLALPTPLFSLRYLAWWCSLTAVVVAALLAWGVYHWSGSWIGSRPVRIALATLVVLMPTLGSDSTANITNLIWIFLAALPWALISTEERPRDIVARSTVAALAATSSMLSLFFLPLALGWLVYRRSRAALIVTASFLAGAMLQIAVALVSSTPPNLFVMKRSPADVVNIAEGLGGNVFGTFLLGTRWEVDLGSASGVVAVVLPVIVVVTLLVVLGVGASRRTQVMAGACTLTAIALFAGTAWERGPGVYGLRAVSIAATPRYSVVPVMLLASAVALLVSSRDESARRPSRRAAAWLFVAQTVLVVAVCFSVVTLRGFDTPWTGRVDRVVAQHCAGRPGSTLATVPNLTGGGPGTPLFPHGVFPLTAPCANLR